MKMKNFGLSLITLIVVSIPNGVLADKKTSAYYWSGSIAAVCNLYENGELSEIYAKSYLKRVFPIVNELPKKYKDITYNFFYKINDGSCRKLAP